MTLMQRRRALMGAKKGGGVPTGYVTDGLVFFLDSKQKVSASEWVDLIGGKVFTLTDCSISNGVVFNGTSSNGLMDGAVTHSYANETIELALGFPTNNPKRTMDVFVQPDSNGLGISMRIVLNNVNHSEYALATILNATSQTIKAPLYTELRDGHTISATGNGRCIVGGNVVSTNLPATPSKLGRNMTGLGARVTASGLSSFFPGTIYGIRIYNRILSDNEMLQNQARDMNYYGLS